MVISKDIHTTTTIRNVVVEADGLKLTEDQREAVRLIFLLCGDITGSGSIGAMDLGYLLNNYMKNVDSADNPLTDLDGDGIIDGKDLAILLNNYLKGAVLIE
jgi:hypothetical protein